MYGCFLVGCSYFSICQFIYLEYFELHSAQVIAALKRDVKNPQVHLHHLLGIAEKSHQVKVCLFLFFKHFPCIFSVFVHTDYGIRCFCFYFILSGAGQDLIAEKGGLSAVVAALGANLSDGGIQALGCEALSVISMSLKNQV